MNNSFSISIQGFDKLQSILTNLPQEKFEQIDNEVEGTLYDIAAQAKTRVPKDLGQLSNSITVKKTGKMIGEVAVQKLYAPYVNFGTGLHAAQFLSTQDEEWNAYAHQFYVNGEGRMIGNGFFTNPVNEERIKLIQRVKDILVE